MGAGVLGGGQVGKTVVGGTDRVTLKRRAAAWLAAAALCAAALVPARADYTDGVAAFHQSSLEEAVRLWRKAAWQDDDFQAEMRLADLYANPTESRYYDPVEAYVWYYIASRNDISQRRRGYDDYQVERFYRDALGRARGKQSALLVNLESAQRTDAHDRIVYILACRGAPGFIKLGDIHDTQFSGYDEGSYRDRRGTRSRNDYRDRDLQMVGITSRSLMVASDADALVYYHLAESLGDPIAKFKLNALEDRLRDYELGRRLIEEQSKKFHYWYPPFEYYPQGDSDSRIPHTDECPIGFARARAMAAVAAALPQLPMRQALFFLGWGKGDIKGIQRFQLTLGDPPTGKLTAGEAVRAIQMAAVRGDASSQNALGVMYSKGIGVVLNYARAAYWFQRAADQRYGAALYHLGVLYKVGPTGIRQDLSRANDYFTAAALAGFRPSLNQLGEMLARAANAPPQPGQR